MGYERNDRRYDRGERGYGGYEGGDRARAYWNPSGEDRTRSYANYGGASASRDYRGDRFNDRSDEYRSDRYREAGSDNGAFGRDSRADDGDDRGFFERAGDEVRSWFGDEEAERRRREDLRYERYGERSDSGQGYGYRGYRSRHEHDPHYRSWRDRQMEALDRDYDEYRREHQSRFDSEFGTWRQSRQGQRSLLQRVQEHQEVIASDGEHVGTVDKVRGDRILLTKSDSDAHGHHHSIPSAWISSVEDKVTINKTADQARQHWRDEDRNSGSGLFSQGNERGVDLNRSFSGTY